MSQGTFGFLAEPARESLAPGAVLLRGFARSAAEALLAAIDEVALAAPFRNMEIPGGHRMSVAMTNCGERGWSTDQHGYRYAEHDPTTGLRWPAMSAAVANLAREAAAAAGYVLFEPDACLVNRYEPGARMTLHQDRNERDFAQPIVSVSLGLPAVFQFGGLQRTDRPRRVPLAHGDVVVWGGPSRRFFHGVLPLQEGLHPATGRVRYNLTLRVAR